MKIILCAINSLLTMTSIWKLFLKNVNGFTVLQSIALVSV